MTADRLQPAPGASRYKLLRQLGEGGVGQVFVALDSETGEQLALKKLTRMSPLHVLRFKREFRAVADIRHRNLVKLYELEHADDGWFLTMELVEGGTLVRSLETSESSYSERKHLAFVVDTFHQLAQGVHAIHQAGMLHRDLKPSNVMLDRQGRVVVLDFGLVRELAASNDQVTLQGTAAGTPAYVPPEQASAEELSAASDWYAFGVMLYEALSGMLPFEGRTPAELISRKLRFDAPEVPEDSAPRALRVLCARLLRRSPEERPTAQEILAVLVEHLDESSSFTSAFNSLPPQTLTGHSSMDLFGRDAERLQLEDALARCIREHVSVAVHVRGLSGSGKTSLVQSFLADSVPLALGAAADPLVLRSRCYEREAMPFKSIDGAVDALATHLMKLDDLQVAHLLPQEIPALTALFPVLERVPAVRQLMAARKNRGQGDALSVRRRAEEGFRSLLYSLALVRPLVIWIDDLQWGDLDSTRVLQDWLKRPLDAPVLLVLSYRSDEVATSTSLSMLLAPEAKSAQLTRELELDLQPLKDSDVYALCAKRLGTASSLPPPVIARIVRGAQGNPFLATQLTALACAKLARDEDLTALSVNELVVHTSALLPQPAQQLLHVLAVAGRPLAPRVALHVAEVASDQRAHIHELQTLRLVRTRYVAGASLLEVYHDRVRESVTASLADDERERIHRALLSVLLAEGHNDPAWLHELALGAVDRVAARRYGMLAAEAASDSLAFERAAELYERCVQLTAAENDTAQLWQKLALARVRCRKGALAAEAYLKASELAPPDQRLALQKLAASHLLRSGRFEEGEHLVQQLLAELKLSVPASETGLYAAIGWERARIAVLESLVRPRDGVPIPTDVRQIGTLYGNLALDTQCYMPLRATLFQMRATRICFQYGDRELTARAYCLNAALSTLSADSSASQRVDEMLARAEKLIGDDARAEIRLELYSAKAVCGMLLGRLAEVLDPARAAEEVYASNSASGEHGDYFYMFVVRSALVSALQFLGRHREAAEVVRRILEDADATDNRCAALQVTMVRTGIEQVENSCQGSRARLDLERSELPKAGVSVLHILHTMAAMRTACMTSEHDWALQLYDELEPKLQASPLQRSSYLMYLLRVFHARLVLNHHVASKGHGDPELLVREHMHWLAKKAPVPFRKPAPTRLRARLAALRGDRERSRELLELSRAAHAEIGAADEAERDRYALGLLLGGAEGAKHSELAIAALRNMGVKDPEREIRAYYPELAHGA